MTNAECLKLVDKFLTVRGAGFICRQQAPNERALVEFVRFKMRYFKDDIPHEDILAETD